jgi:hypothetical protein
MGDEGMRTNRFGTVALVFLFGACTDARDDGVPPGDDDSSSVRAELESGREFVLVPSASTLDVTVQRREGEAVRASLAVLGGDAAASVAADGEVRVERLRFDVDDIVMRPETLPPDGLHLTGVRLALDTLVDVRTQWTNRDNDATIQGEASLLLDWAVKASDGRVLPLATQHLPPLPFTASLRRSASGTLAANVGTVATGVFWTWGDILELSDLAVDLSAEEDPNVDY